MEINAADTALYADRACNLCRQRRVKVQPEDFCFRVRQSPAHQNVNSVTNGYQDVNDVKSWGGPVRAMT